MRPTRGLGSAPLPGEPGWSPSYLALLRVELAAFHSDQEAGIVTVALVLALRRTGVTRYLALWSSDFPQPGRLPGRPRPSGRLADTTILLGRTEISRGSTLQGVITNVSMTLSAASFHGSPSP